MKKQEDDETLEQRFSKVLANLSDEDRQVVEELHGNQRSALVRATISQVMARNNSHNIGPAIRRRFG